MARSMYRLIGLQLAVCLLLFGTTAQGQIDLGVVQAQAVNPSFSQFKARGTNRVPLMVRVPYQRHQRQRMKL